MANKALACVKNMFRDFEAAKGFAYCARNCIVNAATENGHVEIELVVVKEHLNPPGTMHGGFTATLVNIASAAAVIAAGRPTPGRSLDLNVSYLSAAKEGETIIAESTVQRTTRNIAFINTTVYRKADHAIIATGQDTKTFLPST